MTLCIEPVGTDRRALHTFIGLPAQLYAGMPGYAPPLRMDRNHLLHPRHAEIFRRGKVAYWLVWRDGRPVGRISAQVDPVLPQGVPARTGLFGALDAADDPQVVAALIAKAEDWLRAQGCTHAFGPCLLDINTEPGLLVDGNLEPPMTLTAWHPPYLGPMMALAGYERWRDLHCWKVRPAEVDPQKISQIRSQRTGQKSRLDDITLRHPTWRNLSADARILCDLYNAAWADNWGFVPLVDRQMTAMLRTLWPILPAEAVKIVELRGKPMGMLMTIPNLFELTAGIAPDPSPLGWLRLGWRILRFQPRSGRVILFGLRPELRHSALGAAVLLRLFGDLVQQQARFDVDWIEAGWVLENNSALTSVLERFGFHRNKTLRLYGKPLDAVAQGASDP